MQRMDDNAMEVHVGDCLDIMAKMEPASVDLAYLDPPFFTRKPKCSTTRDGNEIFSFDDAWKDRDAYGNFLAPRIDFVRMLLKETGSIFVHCDRNASHLIRLVLDHVFGSSCFRSEIIWHFRRWSNNKPGLLPGHQTILFYSKSDRFKFRTIHGEYSPATNVDQILQKRTRDERNKAVYARDQNGDVIHGGAKKGVPLSDVWDIPFLNPKARERVGYPTQKPVTLLRRIVEIGTDAGDLVLDPFCGSGTTLVAAMLTGRRAVGIDISPEAIRLTKDRLDHPIVSASRLMRNGRESYRRHGVDVAGHLFGIGYTPIQRNSGLDAVLSDEANNRVVFVRVQRAGESVRQAAAKLKRAARAKGDCELVLVVTHPDLMGGELPEDVEAIPSTAFGLARYLNGGGPQIGQPHNSRAREGLARRDSA